MNYNEFKRRAYANAVKHGFRNEKLSNAHYLMLVVTEIAEMVEADRNNSHTFNNAASVMRQSMADGYKFEDLFEAHIKDTVEDEFADAAIRLFDLAGALGIDFERMNPCRYVRSFGNFSFTENALGLVKGISREDICTERRILFALNYLESWANTLNINLGWHIVQKMRYNESRPYMHGKKY